MSQPERAGALDVAVIGMAGRFPGAASVRQLWENLCQGREGIRVLTDEEVEAAGVPRHIREDPNFVKAAGVLDGVDLFDASFFGFTPREAELMLPQQRLFLECSHQALEAGGYGAEGNRGRVGVFGGMSGGGYGYERRVSPGMALPSQESLQETIGREKDFLTTQVSYRLNLRGPSMDVQTACSTSLVAVHLACLNLLTRECDLALAGGASLSVPQTAGYLYREGGILSRDGHCRPFDARASGTVPGNGVAVVLLKRLDDALADGDWVHAVIKGSAVNNDGRQKVGFTAPSVDGQAEVIADALAAAGVAGESIGYVEAHGTGTALGDPVEVAALVQAFATARRRNCAIGALKASIGHLDAAAGVAGLIKAVMCLEHRKIPLSLHFEEPSRHIDFAESPFYVNAKTIEWQRGQSERRAAVSAFGIGGTNAHLVLEEAPPRAASAATGSSQVLVLSARSEAALDRATTNLKDHLQARADLDLANVCYTLQVGRSTFPFRRAAVCRDSREAVETLASSDVGPGGTLAMAGSSSGDDVLLVALARLWSQGVEVDWSSLRADGRGQRVPLPTYPFERKRFWIGRGHDDAAPPDIGGATVGTADLADWFHMPGWRRAIPSEHLEPRLEGEWPRTWIVFLDPEGPGARVVEALLRRPGLHVTEVLAGRRFERTGEQKYVIDPGAPEDYAALLRSSNASAQPALGIVHAWAAASPEGAWESSSPPEWATKELASLSFLAQALKEGDIRSPVQVEVLTQGLFRVTGRETIWPDRGFLMGSCREMAGDRPDVTCRLFDLGPSGEQEMDVAQSASLMAEFFAAAIDPIVAYRTGQRWVPSLEPLPLRRDGGLPSRVRPGGAYVITGGLRQPGLAMARSLAERGARAVVFQTDASSTDADPGLLAQLRDLGAEASLVSTDLSSPQAVEDLLSGVMRRFGRLNGVIHCPVLPASGPLEGRRVPEALESFGLLVRATSTLHEALERRAADFMILCGSSDWLVSRAVEVGECALAAFLAAFTHAEAGGGLATQVVLWPRSLPPTEGPPTDFPSVDVSEAFTRVLGTRLPEVVVAPHDLRRLVEEVLTRRPRPRKSIETGDALALRVEHGRPSALAEYRPPQDEAERQIAGLWEGLFGIRPIGREDSFLDLGGNSLLAIQMISDLRKVLDIEIPLSSVFENPSVSGLARVARGLTQSAQGVERFLSDVESLSPEEAQALLTRELEEADEQ